MSQRALTTYASLRFMGDTLNLGAVTPVLGVEPKIAYHKGDVWKKTSSGHEVRGRTNLWLYESRAVGSPYLRDHITDISDILWGRRSQLGSAFDAGVRRLLARGVTLNVSLFWYGPAGASLPVIDPAFRALVEGYNGKIDTDFDTDDEEDEAA